jgi:hypothetical protein
MFQLLTDNFGLLCSTKKSIDQYMFEHGAGKLVIYPNPVLAGAPFTIEGANENSKIEVYNFMGACASNVITTDNFGKLALHLPAGIYLIRVDNKEGKIIVIE